MKKAREITSKITKPVLLGLAALGGITILKSIVSLTSSFFSLFRSPLNFPERYGHQSWVIITGASRGIGYTWAQKFASLGFNLVLIGTNQSVQTVAQKFTHVKTIPLILDLTNPESIKKVLEVTQDLDVSILVNNAGVAEVHHFHEISPLSYEKQIELNIFTLARLTHAMLQRFRIRINYSAIIFMSSLAGRFSLAFSSVYSGTKAFTSIFAGCLAKQVGQTIDILCVEPSIVNTDMTSFAPQSVIKVSPQSCVQGAILDLGKQTYSFGATKHNLLAWYYSWLSFESVMDSRAETMRNIVEKKIQFRIY